MAYRTEEEIRESQALGDLYQVQSGVENLPPGFIEGFRPVLGPDMRVTIDPGIANVQGYRVQKSSHLLRKANFVHGQNGGDEGLTYYVYLDKDGQYSAELTAPQFSDARFYYEHPVTQKRAILRLFVNDNDDIVFASKKFQDTKEVLVASSTYVGDADYYCTGENDQHIIRAAFEYAQKNDGLIFLTTGNFSVSGTLVIPENVVMNGSSGTMISGNPTENLIALSDGSFITNMELQRTGSGTVGLDASTIRVFGDGASIKDVVISTTHGLGVYARKSDGSSVDSMNINGIVITEIGGPFGIIVDVTNAFISNVLIKGNGPFDATNMGSSSYTAFNLSEGEAISVSNITVRDIEIHGFAGFPFSSVIAVASASEAVMTNISIKNIFSDTADWRRTTGLAMAIGSVSGLYISNIERGVGIRTNQSSPKAGVITGVFMADVPMLAASIFSDEDVSGYVLSNVWLDENCGPIETDSNNIVVNVSGAKQNYGVDNVPAIEDVSVSIGP